MSELPISEKSLIYGSSDGGTTVLCEDEKALKMCNQVGTSLNLKVQKCETKNAKQKSGLYYFFIFFIRVIVQLQD